MGGGARRGRDKLTLLASPGLASFGLWIEQLVAESTGKNDTGVVPVDGEPLAPGTRLGDDRLFVATRLADDDNADLDRFLADLEERDRPVLRIDVGDRLDLGGEMFRWELATAVAGAMLGIQPFDQPDVQSTKKRTGEILDGLAAGGAAPPVVSGDPIATLRALGPGEWVALMVYGEPTVALDGALTALRRALGESLGVATTLGIGPRFLHSTGQLHKGGGAKGVYLQLVLDEGELPIPGRPYGFGALIAAQAAGDLAALRGAGRRAFRLDAGGDPVGVVRRLAEEFAA
jgi:hypothetical protein